MEVKTQMYRIHDPHRRSGYLAQVKYSSVALGDGQVDWDIYYSPGPKAFREYTTFTNKQAGAVPRSESSLVLEAPRTELASGVDMLHADTLHTERLQLFLPGDLLPPPCHEDRQQDGALSQMLLDRGVTRIKAQSLLKNLKQGQDVCRQIEYVDTVVAKATPEKFRNPAGFYVTFISANETVPSSFKTRTDLDREASEQARREKERIEDCYLESKYEEYLEEAVSVFIAQVLPADEYAGMLAAMIAKVRGKSPRMPRPAVETTAKHQLALALRSDARLSITPIHEFRSKPS